MEKVTRTSCVLFSLLIFSCNLSWGSPQLIGNPNDDVNPISTGNIPSNGNPSAGTSLTNTIMNGDTQLGVQATASPAPSAGVNGGGQNISGAPAYPTTTNGGSATENAGEQNTTPASANQAHSIPGVTPVIAKWLKSLPEGAMGGLLKNGSAVTTYNNLSASDSLSAYVSLADGMQHPSELAAPAIANVADTMLAGSQNPANTAVGLGAILDSGNSPSQEALLQLTKSFGGSTAGEAALTAIVNSGPNAASFLQNLTSSHFASQGSQQLGTFLSTFGGSAQGQSALTNALAGMTPEGAAGLSKIMDYIVSVPSLNAAPVLGQQNPLTQPNGMQDLISLVQIAGSGSGNQQINASALLNAAGTSQDWTVFAADLNNISSGGFSGAMHNLLSQDPKNTGGGSGLLSEFYTMASAGGGVPPPPN